MLKLKFKCVGITEGTHDEAVKDDKGHVQYEKDGTTPKVVSHPAMGATLQLLQKQEGAGVEFTKGQAIGQVQVNRMSSQLFTVGETYAVRIDQA